MDDLRRTALLALLACVPLLPGCPAGQRIASAIAEAESFTFKYLLLQPDAADRYALGIGLAGRCTLYTFTESQMSDMFTSMTYTPVGGSPGSATFEFSSLDDCNAYGEVSYETADLVEVVRDANGQVIETRRPRNPGKLVDANLRPGGTLSFLVHGVQMNLTSVSRTSAPGPMTPNAVNVPGWVVGGSAGEIFDPAHLSPGYFNFMLQDILTGPDRIVGRFSLLAKSAPSDARLLVIWGGDMVLRTDL